MARPSTVKDAMGYAIELKPGPLLGSVQAIVTPPIVLDRRSLDKFYRECNAIINSHLRITYEDRS